MGPVSRSIDIYSFYYSDINLFLIMPAVNYVIYACSSSRKTPGVITVQELHTGEKHCCSYYSR